MNGTYRADLSWTTGIAALLVAFTVSKVLKFVSGLKAVDYLPGLRVPFQPLGLPSIILPDMSWNPGVLFAWTWRRSTKNIYRRFGNDTVSVVPFIYGRPTLYTQSIEVARQIVSVGEKTGVFGKGENMTRLIR
ncbi:hypothetical protein AZE42_13619 [Rhizopogon vesiculosus]|uniref:Uncharacterized protein n=1 Tax=Rhizopogon vesiculosus TaxID=180088 RepID=A0A1J8QSS1_9AGAM|nr:hypothetical protein AZE42_13619 [Rhizopogon vesiculosus]